MLDLHYRPKPAILYEDGRFKGPQRADQQRFDRHTGWPRHPTLKAIAGRASGSWRTITVDGTPVRLEPQPLFRRRTQAIAFALNKGREVFCDA